MGNCNSKQNNSHYFNGELNEPYICYICYDNILSKKYLHCRQCGNYFHVKCLYEASKTMNECLVCDNPCLSLIDVNPTSSSKLKPWSGKFHSRASTPLPPPEN